MMQHAFCLWRIYKTNCFINFVASALGKKNFRGFVKILKFFVKMTNIAIVCNFMLVLHKHISMFIMRNAFVEKATFYLLVDKKYNYFLCLSRINILCSCNRKL